MAVITLTREMGSLGNRVAQIVARRLGLRLVCHELVHSLAGRTGLRPSAVGRFVEGGGTLAERLFIDSRRLGLCTAEELLELASQGNVIVRGWGASHVLKPVPHAMHVRVRAPIGDRVDHMLKRMETLDSRAWQREIESSDRQYSHVIERMYGMNSWKDPSHYHLVVDTSERSVEECAERVIEMADRPQFRETDESRRVVADCLLAARIKARIHESSKLRDSRIEVSASQGAVTLDGIVEAELQRDLAARIASAFDSVRQVENRVRVMREAANYAAE